MKEQSGLKKQERQERNKVPSCYPVFVKKIVEGYCEGKTNKKKLDKLASGVF